MKDERGSASIFIMTVLSAIMILQSVLLHYGRSMVAEHRADQALESALRSAFGGFDPALQAYGLYGLRNADGLRTEALKHAAGLLESKGDTLSRFDGEADITSWHIAGTLGEPDHFRKQILDEMAYRAPLEWSFTFWDKLRGNDVGQSMANAKAFGAQAKRAEALLKKRDAALLRAWERARWLLEPGGALQEWITHYEQELSAIQGFADQAGVTQADELRRSIQELKQSIGLLEAAERTKAVVDRLEALKQRLTGMEAALDAYVRFTVRLQSLIVRAEMDNSRLQQWHSEYAAAMQEARNTEGEIEDLLSAGKKQTGYLNKLLFGGPFFVRQSTNASELTALHNRLGQLFANPAYRIGKDFSERFSLLQQSVQAVYQHAQSWFPMLKQADSRRKIMQQSREEQSTKTKQSIASVLSQAERAISGCGQYSNETYLLMPKDRYGEEAAGSISTGLDEPEQIGMSSLGWADKFEEALYDFRDRMYVNEFALSKFNYRTFEQSKDSAFREIHKLYNQEIEYVLYGFDSCHMNRAAAFTELFALRLAVRTAEALASPGKAAMAAMTPWLMFLAAVAEGAAKAWSDVQRLLDGEEVELSSRLLSSVRLGYKDYLRLFLTVHGEEDATLRRIQRLIDLNTGLNLHDAATAIEASLKATLTGSMLNFGSSRPDVSAEAKYAY